MWHEMLSGPIATSTPGCVTGEQRDNLLDHQVDPSSMNCEQAPLSLPAKSPAGRCPAAVSKRSDQCAPMASPGATGFIDVFAGNERGLASSPRSVRSSRAALRNDTC